MTTTSPEFSEYQIDFLDRVAVRLRAKGMTKENFDNEIVKQTVIETFEADINLTETLLDNSESTREFREQFKLTVLNLINVSRPEVA